MSYNCLKCPAYCCTYPLIEVSRKDIKRLARHLGLGISKLKRKYLKWDRGEKAYCFKHKKDRIFESVCTFFDTKKRRCTVYEGRPSTCRDYPFSKTKCGYWELLTFERDLQKQKRLNVVVIQ